MKTYKRIAEYIELTYNLSIEDADSEMFLKALDYIKDEDIYITNVMASDIFICP